MNFDLNNQLKFKWADIDSRINVGYEPEEGIIISSGRNGLLKMRGEIDRLLQPQHPAWVYTHVVYNEHGRIKGWFINGTNFYEEPVPDSAPVDVWFLPELLPTSIKKWESPI